MKLFSLCLCILLGHLVLAQDLPTLYEYYSEGGVSSGLTEKDGDFMLNGKLLHLLSGSMHYFRIPPQYWRDRLRKLRAAGLNAVQTYVSWNQHEKHPGQFDFTGQLDVRRFIEIAKEEDLLVIFRPGPFICAEFEFGGLPSWLLKDENLKVRQSYGPYEERAGIYLQALMETVKDLQWSDKYGAQPIISVQIENEYASFASGLPEPDKAHLAFLLEEMKSSGMNYVKYFTSDSVASYGDIGSIPEALMTVNFAGDGQGEFDALDKYQPGRPKMVTEYWSGWFDHWSQDQHSVTDLHYFEVGINNTFKNKGSINFYMFHGGTSYGFQSGANIVGGAVDYLPDTNSYDYDAPLSESGDYTEKYYRTIELFDHYNRGPQLKKPDVPPETPKTKYEDIKPQGYLDMAQLIDQAEHDYSDVVVSMENLPTLNPLQGFLVYSQPSLTLASPSSTLKIEGHIRDIAYILVDGKLINQPVNDASELEKTVGFWPAKNSEWTLEGDGKEHRVDIVVEAMGRNNFGHPQHFNQKKGLWEGQVFLDDKQLSGWTITPLEFPNDWTRKLSGWKEASGSMEGPHLFKANLEIADEPKDTWINTRAEGKDMWVKGVVWVNGINLSRYWNLGPTQTMFLPAPFLKQGSNEIYVLEMYKSGEKITFADKANL